VNDHELPTKQALEAAAHDPLFPVYRLRRFFNSAEAEG
jgi:hypothetical protein